VRVPGHEGVNLVYLRRFMTDGILIFDAECRRHTTIGDPPCPAWQHGLVCYHAKAAVKVAAHDAGCNVVGWASDERTATRLLNLRQYKGCEIGRLVPRGGGKSKYFLWRKA
jgi:hypothetical protein